MEENNARGVSEAKKIAIVGSDSTGKTTLVSHLAEKYDTLWVPEYARTYLDDLGRHYTVEDLNTIARGQLNTEAELLPTANRFLFCDTTLITIKIWSEHKFGYCSEEILQAIHTNSYDLHLLLAPDFPWEEDEQREQPHLRSFFHDIFKKELQDFGIPFHEITGSLSERKETVYGLLAEM